MVKLVNGSWMTAGDGQNGCAASLHVDASDTLWAACLVFPGSYQPGQLKVQTLAAGVSTWFSAGAVGPTSATPESLVRARQILRSTPNPRWSTLIAAVVQ